MPLPRVVAVPLFLLDYLRATVQSPLSRVSHQRKHWGF
jgi:hypothetical protein